MNLSTHTPVAPNRALIRQSRQRLNLTQVDLASMSGVSLATIANLESGVLTNPKLSTLNAVAKVFNLPTLQLLAEVPR
jgi:transcriptional regulator with XRE-family HTH domain